MDIGTRQNEEWSISLLRARQVVAKKIGQWQVIQGLLVAVCPASFALVLIFTTSSRPWAVLLPLVVAVIDPLVIDRKIKALTVEQAKLAEMFDCRVFGLGWDKYIAGPEPLDVDIKAMIVGRNVFDGTSLHSWYPTHAGIRHIEQVLEAQAATVFYDWQLRKSYFRFLWVVAVLFFPAIFILGFFENPSLQDFVVVLAPIIPIASWFTRELLRAYDAEAKNAELYKLIIGQRGSAAPASGEAADGMLRSLQSALFLKRSKFPWVPIFYKRQRRELEAVINKPVSNAAATPAAVPPAV